MVLNVTDKWARAWFETGDGQAWLEDNGLPKNPYYAPERECREGDPQPILEINLSDGQVVSAPTLEIKGTADASEGFKKWTLEYGQGEDPGSWTLLAEGNNPVKDGTFTTWNLSSMPNGIVTLRLNLVGEKTEVDKRIRLNLSLPTPTVPPLTPTETPSPTSFPTDTPTPTLEIIIPTDTPTLAPAPTETPTTAP